MPAPQKSKWRSPETRHHPQDRRRLSATAELRLPIFASQNFDAKTTTQKAKIDFGTPIDTGTPRRSEGLSASRATSGFVAHSDQDRD